MGELGTCDNCGCYANLCDDCAANASESKLIALLTDGLELAKAVKMHCARICTCSREYRVKNMQDPSCEYCDVGKFLIPMAEKIIGS